MTTDHLLGTKQLSFSSIFHFLQFFFDSTLSFRRIPIDTIARSMTRKSENYQEEASFIKFYLLNFFTKRNNTTSTTYKCIHFQYPFQILHRNKHITRPFHFPFHNQPFSSAFCDTRIDPTSQFHAYTTDLQFHPKNNSPLSNGRVIGHLRYQFRGSTRGESNVKNKSASDKSQSHLPLLSSSGHPVFQPIRY